MNNLDLSIIYFSPTGSTAKVARAVADGTKLNYDEYDLTYDRELRKQSFGEKDMLIVAIPVFAGRVPELLVDVFSKIKGKNTYFLPVVVYGNRAVEDALIELDDIFKSNGFITIGYGIFIGEHSYSEEFGTGRPNQDDLEAAKNYGKVLIDRIEKVGNNEDRQSVFQGTIPGNRPYKDRASHQELWGPVATDSCTFCGECLKICPVDAIDHLNPKKTDYNKCIHCCACIKICEEDAKHMEGQTISKVMDMLNKVARERKEIELG